MTDVRAVVAATLRTAAEWGLVFPAHGDGAALPARDELLQIADLVTACPPSDEICCPLCEEIDCDDGCPLAGHRRATTCAVVLPPVSNEDRG